MSNIFEQLYNTPENLINIFIETPTYLILGQIVNGEEPELKFLHRYLEIYIEACLTPEMQANAIINKVEWLIRYLQYVQCEIVIAKNRLKHINDYTK